MAARSWQFGGAAYAMKQHVLKPLLPAVVLALFGSACAKGWHKIRLAGPGDPPHARWNHTATWDSHVNRLLVFGGFDGDVPRNDLWRWTESNGWALLTANAYVPTPPTQPTFRREHGAAWDSQRNRLLVFGGSTGDQPGNNDLWEYRAGWRVLTPDGATTSPAQRLGHAAVWDSERNRLLIFGGNAAGAGRSNDLWAYTPIADTVGTWQVLTANGAAGAPPKRHRAAMAWDAQTNRLLLFGGDGSGGRRNDLWQWTEAAGWKQLTADGASGAPPDRVFHAAVWDAQASRLLIFGGYDGSYRNDLWQYASAGGWTLLTADGADGSPHGRLGHGAAWDTQSNRLLVFGGFAGYRYNDVWQYTASGGWRQPVPDGNAGPPLARDAHTAAWDTQRDRMLVFGGMAGDDNLFRKDLWSFASPGGWQRLVPDDAVGAPPRRGSSAATWDTQANRLLVFGGFHVEGTDFYTLNDLWAYSSDSGWKLLPDQGGDGPPQPRHSHVAVWDAQGQRLIVFGGSNYNDLWAYTAAGSWQRLTPQGAPGAPAPRSAAVGAWDSEGNRLLVFGGALTPATADYYNDLWQYTAAGGWQQLTANGAPGSPPPRRWAAGAWDGQRRRLLVFGGGESPFRSDLWEYTDAGGWRVLTTEGAVGGPPPRSGHTAVWDAQRRRLLVHGGHKGGTRYADLWWYRDARFVPHHPIE